MLGSTYLKLYRIYVMSRPVERYVNMIWKCGGDKRTEYQKLEFQLL
jgi:hypothetical protein